MKFRTLLFTAISSLAISSATAAQAEEWHTTTSLIGTSKYASGMTRYDHVNPDAPKGGTLNSIAPGTFDSFNPFIIKGTPAAGLTYSGGILYDSLMEQSVDEPSASYPMVAEAFKFPDDFSSATYRINPKARFHDGTPITAEDVAWSFTVLKANYPLYNKYYGNVSEARVDGPLEVTFVFDQKNNRELPHIMGDLPVLPKHWWVGNDKNGNKRNINQPTLEKPLGSGPYKIASSKTGSEIIWERVKDYWAKDIGVRKGRFNFDRIRFTYFLDSNAEWQAFTKGGLEDYRLENRSQKWAIGYDFPAFENGRVIKRTFPSISGEPFQGFTLNTRKDKFKDRRVRQALTWAFDYETMNKNLFYGLYTRTDNYFEGTDLASSGLPEGLELEILEAYRGKIPDEVFTEEFKLPVFGSRSDTRKHLRTAFGLFKQAGWSNKGGKLINDKSGEQFKIEFLGASPSSERVVGPYIANLKRLGIDATLRIVDPSQYVNRVRRFEFDVFTAVSLQSQSPGNEQREYWNSKTADTPGSRNWAGIKDPVIDEIIEKIIFAKNREELVALTHALDRILLWQFYYVPQWHNPSVWIAHWDKFGIPEPQPKYAGVDIYSWWIDKDKAAALKNK